MNNIIDTKICTKCGDEKEISEFRAHPKTKDGKKTECKNCDDFRQHQYYLKNRKKRIKQVIKNRKLKKKEKEELEKIKKIQEQIV